MFVWPTKIRLVDTDAAGRIFFASLLRIAHEAFEEFMASRGQPIHVYVHDGECALAIVHTEADFRMPLRCGDAVEIRVAVERIGDTSFSIGYSFVRDGHETATAKTVHVALNRDGTKRAIPDALRNALQT